MSKRTHTRFYLHLGTITLILVGLYAVTTIGYYHLPWSFRKNIYKRAPTIDRTLRRNGFNLLQFWDDLAWWGHDAQTQLDISFRGDQIYAGVPIFLEPLNLLENRGYTVGYSDALKNPRWVAYRIFDVPNRSSGPRFSFRIDRRTRTKVRTSDYTHSGFDRGHMAPNYGIATRYGAEAQKETFLMSNIIPQSPHVNRHIWKDLEMRVAKQYGRYFSEVWVITGPIFREHPKQLKSGIPIPSHYYKIIVDENDEQLRVLAFLIEQHCPPYTRIKTRLVSVDEIEKRTGLDFFSNLPLANQSQLEAESATRLWPSLIPAIKHWLHSVLIHP